MALLVAYWYKDGLDVYRFVDKKPVKVASGSLEGLKPIKGVLDKKILIVGRDLLLHIRKKYPPAPVEKLLRAVGLEIGDIFPISKPAFYCRVHESSTAYTMLDIWAWESEPYSRLREVFPFRHIVPEDLAYSSDVPEVKIFQWCGMTHILAHSGNRFLGGASYTDSNIDEKDVEMFLSGLGPHREDIKQLKVYGTLPFPFKNLDLPKISRIAEKDYPPCIDYISGLNLQEFKIKREYHLSSNVNLLCRIFLYLILGYGIMLYLPIRNYDQIEKEIIKKIKAVDAKISLTVAGQEKSDYSGVLKEINEKLSIRHPPLNIMNTLAKNLPAGSFITRMVLSENNLEMNISSKDPILVVKTLGETEGIKTARLKGAPLKDSVTGSYIFAITLELSR